MNDSDKIFKAFSDLTATKGTYHNKWICDESLVRILHMHYKNLKDIDKMRSKLVKRLNSQSGAFDNSNTKKLYAAKFQAICPFTATKRRIYYYYVGTGLPPQMPSNAVACSQAPAILSFSKTNDRQRSCNMPKQKSLPDEGSAGKKNKRKAASHTTEGGAAKSITPTPTKKRCSPRIAEQQFVPFSTQMGEFFEDDGDDEDDEDDDDNNNTDSGGGGGDSNNCSSGSSTEETIPLYWLSPEAALLFGFDHGADVYNGLEKLIETFSTVLQSWQGYATTNIIQFDNDGGLTHHAIFELRNKCLYLRTAYQIALEELQVGVKWEDCCNKAASKLAPLGFNAASNGRTIMKWNRIFRQMHQFPNPDPYVANGLKRKPPIFEIFPSAAVDMSNFILDKLDHFHVEMLRDYVKTTLLEQLNEEVTNNENFTEDSDEYKLVAKYVDTPPSYSTVLRWVGYLGFKRELAKKCYYVDGHEYPEQLRHRAWFTTEYLSKLEVRSHRWVHLTQTEFSALKDSLDEEKEKEMLEKVKYSFKGDNDEDMLEFHVDKHKRLQEIANWKYGAYGGRTSTRMDPNHKPVIIFGQDEAIFHAHLSMTHQWVDPNGRRALMPKTQGVGIMISGFQSRELGWGIPITKDQLVQINANRAREEYFDKEAALAVYGTTKKKPLESSPGIVKFPYGKENGYWTGRHMNLQTEDVIDVVKVTHGDTYEYVFLFDSSSGHAKKRGDGLDAKSMKKEWHSKPSGMRNVKMERKEGYLGPHLDPSVRAMVVIGQEQTMDFTSDLDKELGPFWLTAQQREEQRHDREVEIPLEQRKRRVKQKSELIPELMLTGWGKLEGQMKLWKMKHPELVRKAAAQDIEINITPATKTVHGWEGKGKGLLQVAYERGWIDKKNYKSYLVMKYDDDGNLIPELSLRHLIASCTDFQTEKSQLEYVCESLGAKALITTKYHAEYAGEGTEVG
mmetsp:Transcript_383/g.861  ORF Transcript_383/g.861 Transcript_383/m.861 type:complete len:956 (-) Transcript_383:398-3265(-)